MCLGSYMFEIQCIVYLVVSLHCRKFSSVEAASSPQFPSSRPRRKLHEEHGSEACGKRDGAIDDLCPKETLAALGQKW